jgi:hypothetical protein
MDVTVVEVPDKQFTVQINCTRNGRFTTANGMIVMKLPQIGPTVFHTVGSSIRERQDKDAPGIGYGISVARCLRAMARQIEEVTMEEVHKRCASRDEYKGFSTDELASLGIKLCNEALARIAKEDERIRIREEYVELSKHIPHEVVEERRRTRRLARVTQTGGKSSKRWE